MDEDAVTVISVNGQHGDDFVKRQSNLDHACEALVRYNGQRDKHGEHGVDASTPMTGGPGGLRQPVINTEVAPRRKLVLSAIGGNGETGRKGGDGHSGLSGTAGAAATQMADAENGTDGGRGTNGGNGGDGGSIQILLGHDMTHLLYAVSWDVSGGSGAAAGEHGRAGKGGAGGAGGEGTNWEQFVGYRYRCTPNCLGKNTQEMRATSPSNALLMASTSLARSGTRARAAIGSESVSGGLNTAVALIASRYHARPQQRVNQGACHCVGGHGDCAGCDSQPITRSLHRVSGQPGQPGRDGLEQTSVLKAGLPGAPGKMVILVQNLDGTISEYDKPWKLRIVSFDIEDENGDGIFEPGGMPSPVQGIELLIKPSEHVLLDDKGKLFLPSSIAPSTVATVEGYISAKIRQAEEIVADTAYMERGAKISLAAVLPWLNVELPEFELERTFDIQFPCALSNFRVLPSLSPGSSSTISWEITNLSYKAIGNAATSPRAIEVVASVPREYGTLGSEHTTIVNDSNEVPVAVAHIEPKATSISSQVLKILPEGRAPSRFYLTVALYIADSVCSEEVDAASEVEMILAQMIQIEVNVSKSYCFNENAGIVMVVNSTTPPGRVLALHQFIQGELNMTVDCLDVNENGGMQVDEDAELAHLFTKYDGKTVILLGKPFLFQNSPRTTPELCDSRQIRRSLSSGTSFLFLGLHDDRTSNKLFEQVVFEVAHNASNTLASVPKSAKFTRISDFVGAILDQKQNNMGSSSPTVFSLAGRRRRCNGMLSPSIESQAKAASRKLHKLLPQERFLLLPVSQQSGSSPSVGGDQLIILWGAEATVPLRVTEIRDSYSASLDHFEKYSIVAALPVAHRVQQIWDDETDGSTSSVTEAATCSLGIECIRQIDQYAFSAFSSGPVKVFTEDVLGVHLPTVAAVLFHPWSSKGVPQAVQVILVYCLDTCRPHTKRQALAQALMWNSSSRQRLAKYLLESVEALSPGLGAEIQRQADKLRDQELNAMRHVVRRAAKLTRMSEHAFERSTESTMDVVHGSEVCTAEEWDARWAANQDVWKRIAEDDSRAPHPIDTMSRSNVVA
ncbi:unnamed protein product [Cercospora beticola]|nr:unnamed protein product [Cercospora beticola]